jgi:hypothetical protein
MCESCTKPAAEEEIHVSIKRTCYILTALRWWHVKCRIRNVSSKIECSKEQMLVPKILAAWKIA